MRCLSKKGRKRALYNRPSVRVKQIENKAWEK